MPRSKTLIEPIPTAAARHTTFKKRKASLFKKAMELSTLCNVDVCAVVSEGPHDRNPEIWPPREDAMQILAHFCSMSEADKSKKMVDQVGYLFQQMEKLQLQLSKVHTDNCQLETKILLQEVLSGQCSVVDLASFEQMANLAAVVEMRLGEVHKRMHDLASVAPVPHHTAIDIFSPSAGLPEYQMFGVTPNFASVQGWSSESEEKGSGVDDVAPVILGSRVEDEMEKFFDSSDYGCDDEITALLFS